MVQEEDGLQLPPALRLAANSGLGKKKKKDDERMGLKNEAKAMRLRLAGMDDETDSAPRSPSVGSTRSSSRSRPTKSLSIDSNRSSSRSRPTKSLSIGSSRSPSRSRPRRTRSSRPTKSRSTASNFTDGKSVGSWGKYSNEVLNKKIKKVKQMLNETESGSKEFKGLQKKLVEYRAQLRERKQSGDSQAFNISVIEAKDRTAEHDHSDSLSDESDDDDDDDDDDDEMDEKRVEAHVEDHVEKEEVEVKQTEAQVEDQGEQSMYSLDILKRKLKKVEKMLHKSTPGSKEYGKLQKKRTEYERQISQQDVNDRKSRSQKVEQAETGRTDSTRYQSGLAWQKADADPKPEPSSSKIHSYYDLDEKTRKQVFLEEARKLKQDALEKKRREKEIEDAKNRDSSLKSVATEESQRESEESESESSEENAVSKYSYIQEDSQRKKQQYLEEARRLKREALEKKRKEEESSRKGEHDTHGEIKEIQSQHETVSYDDQRKKQQYLEEARRLKREALEKKRKEEELQKNARAWDNEELEKKTFSTTKETEVEDSDDSMPFETEEQRKKEAYLEEARRLKREALEKKKKEEESCRKAESDENEMAKNFSPSEGTRIEEIEDRASFEDRTIDNDDRRQKQAYLEEARRLKEEALRKKSNELKESAERENEEDELQDSKTLEKDDVKEIERFSDSSIHCLDNDVIESKVEEKKEEEQLSNLSPSSDSIVHEEEKIFSDEFQSTKGQENCYTSTSGAKSNAEEQDIPGSIDSAAAETLKELQSSKGNKTEAEPNDSPALSLEFQEELKSKAVQVGEEKDKSNLPQSTDPAANRKKSNFLSEIISKAKGAKKEKHNNDSSEPSPSVEQRKKPSFLNGIMSKAKGAKEKESEHSAQSVDTTTDQKKPSFLDDIKTSSKAAGVEKEQETTLSQSPDPVTHQKKPSFLDSIKSRAKDVEVEKEQEKATSQSPDPVTHQKKPSFLDSIKSRAKDVEVEKEQEKATSQSPDPVTHRKKPSFLDSIKSQAKDAEVEKEHETATSQSPDPVTHRKKPSFLDSIKSRAKGMNEEQATKNRSTASPDSVSRGGKPNFLEELKLKAGDMAKEEQSGEPTPTSDQCVQNEAESGLTKEEGNSKVQGPSDTNVLSNKESLKPDNEKEDNKAKPEEQEGEASKGYLDRRTLPQPLSTNSKKILRELESNEIRQKKLERSLTQNGIQLTEEISYEEAKDKIAEITEAMKALVAGGMESYTAEKEYFRLEEQLSKYSAALMLTDEYAEEVRRMEQEWEESIAADNIAAIRKLRSHMPVNIRHLTEEQLVTTATPNGKTLPRPIARKFKRTNILQLLRVDPDDIEMMHPSLLEGMRTTSLTLTERRALHEHFREVVERWAERRSDPSIEKKWQWYQSLKSKFKETLTSYSRGDKWTIKADTAIDYSDDYGYTTEATYETSGNKAESKKSSPRDALRSKEKKSKVTKSSEAEVMQEYRDRLRLDPDETEIDKKLLRELFHSGKRTKTLEKQLTQAGLSLPKEDISYDVAKARVAELTEELNKVAVNMGNTVDKKELAKLEYTFGSLSQELDKYTNALMLTKEWAEEQKQKEEQWETDISAANLEALKKVRRHMPVNIRNMSEASLASDPTPNGKILPKAIAKKFKRTNILMILRTDPSVIESMHPSSLEAMRTTGLTLTERRAIHEHLKDIAPKWKAMSGDKMCERKWMWHASLQSKLKEMLATDERHIAQYGRPKNADDYSDDYGYPETAQYEQQTVAKSNLLSMEELEKRRQEEDYY